MNGVLIIAHGSRAKEAELTMQAIAELVEAKLQGCLLRLAYNEFSDQTIEAGIDDLVARGADNIMAIPYFLFSGMHVRNDISQKLGACAERHPGTPIVLGEALGVDERLADIVLDRIQEIQP
ncbi:MAG: CbiX/SirB N-terminal domain-containing protein [Coriobacteriia bacterium]|nr:CbiX/SirB N-terminal domain-containing protein [Coriobacteriia bacterium]